MREKYEIYFGELEKGIAQLYQVGESARGKNLDPDSIVEAKRAGDLADRVEGLVGPPGIAEKIREIGRENLSEIIEYLIGNKPLTGKDRENQIEQALRTALAILTEGVVAAPIEGISKVAVRTNPDGSEYLSIYFAGPIRSAGGTAQGLAVLVGDYIRNRLGLKDYRPTPDEIERYIEEIKLYHEFASRLQYFPTDQEIREVVSKLPVCVDGDPTEEREVSVHRDLKRIETNRIRGGMCLVLAEGVIQKSKKVVKHAEDIGLDWGWLKDISKKTEPGKQDGDFLEEDEDETQEVTPKGKFMSEIVGGRPIFASPSAKGALRLRYGKTRATGIAAKAIHPATMVLTGGFIATGTQLKVERPGKGCIITACDSIEGPIVRLKNGDVLRVESVEMAREIEKDLDEILFLGDLLVSYGDFLQTNTSLLPAGYCEQWWEQELVKAGGITPNGLISPDEAVQISLASKVPLHPRYTYRYEDISLLELIELIEYIFTGDLGETLTIPYDEKGKGILERIGLPHQKRGETLVISEYRPLLLTLDLMNEKGELDEIRKEKVLEKIESISSGKPLDALAEIAPYPVKSKSGTYIGCRMGRPEKAKERKMQPAVHALFPIKDYGGRERSVNVASQENTISVEIARYECPRCGNVGINATCERCSTKSSLKKICPSCQGVHSADLCPRCKVSTQYFETRDIDIQQIWRNSVDRIGRTVEVKGVKGMISKYKIPEPLEKGLLRAINNVYVFKDGTIRFDATDAPLSHIKPAEIGVSTEELRRLGYAQDINGDPLGNDEQLAELFVQDVVIPEKAGEYLLRVARFIDQLLTKFYGLEPFYNCSTKKDLLGHLIVGLAPHTSAGITGRIVGFTKANVCFAHPFWHAAKRRNCDGDEDSIMLFLDTLLNFSRYYLPEKRGGQMDAPLVITSLMDPKEVDDEAHKIEIIERFPIEFYEKTGEQVNPSAVFIPTVQTFLADHPFSQVKFTYSTSDITGPVLTSKYVTLKTMAEKVDAQLAVAKKIRATDERQVAALVINSHFLRDTVGNMRAFTRQKVRCVKCNAKYRRIPLSGKCTACGGKLLLTVSEASVKKYLGYSMDLAKKYDLDNYLKQRLEILSMQIDSLFINDLSKQVSLADYM
ncbi:MAG: DNA polymerase II large subunit [Candidatus Altiarchaeota archaeon]